MTTGRGGMKFLQQQRDEVQAIWQLDMTLLHALPKGGEFWMSQQFTFEFLQ